ncbi:hypothetical protein D3C72_2571590 [compost metagenome]
MRIIINIKQDYGQVLLRTSTLDMLLVLISAVYPEMEESLHLELDFIHRPQWE